MSQNESVSGAEDLRTQLRLGVVMTGGVSLAVWMGGVTIELDRLRREVPGSVYAELGRLAEVRPVVDIVAGTSAGGLNGTLLAAAAAWESDLEDLRSVWLGTADLGGLLRPAGARRPPSLLDGDGYFLDQARDAIASVRARGRSRVGTDDARRRAGLPPLHLTVTSTLMRGNTVQLSDSLGSPVSSTTHLGLFRFSTDGGTAFDEQGAVARLARAARSSASFPGAFEASRIDIGGGQVDMASVADFVTPGAGATTRYVIDGGLLANEPIEQVYGLIRDQPSHGPVRRVICYVSPLSGGDDGASPAAPEEPPDLLEVLLRGTLLIPREQSIVGQMRAILGEADRRRGLGRARRALAVTTDNAAELLRAAETLMPVVDQQRARAVAREALERAAEVGQSAVAVAAAGASPDAMADEVARLARRQVLLLLQDLLRRAIIRATGPDRGRLADQRTAVSTVVASGLHDHAAVIAAVSGAYDLLVAAVPRVTAQVVASDAPSPPARILQDDLDDLRLLADAAAGAAPIATTTVTSAATTTTATTHGEETAPEFDDQDHRWRALRALDVLMTASSGSLVPDPQRVDMVQLSANAPNCFDGRRTPESKLTGVQLGHFGAFYRGGWRANDWMWGRLDGAMRIVEMLVDPDPLLATGRPIPELANELAAIAVGPGSGSDHDWLAAQPGLADATARIEGLLTAAADPANPDRAGSVLEARNQIALMVASRVQLQILRQELLHVRTLVAADRATGAASTYEGGLFLEATRQLDRDAPPDRVVEAFRSCLIGRNRLSAELGSDHMTSLSTQALAVASGTVDTVAASRGRAAPVRPMLGSMRWTFRVANALSSGGFRGSELIQVALPTVAVLVAALMALAVADDRSLLQVVFGVGLAGLTVAALVASAGRVTTAVGAIGGAIMLIAGLVVAGTSWHAGPYVGTAMAVAAAALLAALVLRRSTRSRKPVVATAHEAR